VNPMDAIYNAATTAAASVGLPAFWLYSTLTGRYRRGRRERFGFVPREALRRLTGSPKVWVHAVSLGELRVAFSVVSGLKLVMPGCSVLVSTTTEHGFDKAVETFGKIDPVIFSPIDTFFSVKEALRRVRPHAMVFLETEIWPAWIARAHAMGIPTAIVNGRISGRSFKKYRKMRFFFKETLSRVDAFSMTTTGNAERITAMGAPRGRVFVNGNAKYDSLAEQVDPKAGEAVKRSLGLGGRGPVLVCGSTRSGEEALLLDAFLRIRREHPEAFLIIAPRHIERAREIGRIIESRGLEYRIRSRAGSAPAPDTSPVLLLDTFGELFNVYSAATFVFCGASLVPLGGQNPLEPAAWGKPVFYGPSMEDFSDAVHLLESSGVRGRVSGPRMLAEKALALLRSPAALKEQGERALKALQRTQGSGERHARVIAQLLGDSEVTP